MLGSVTVAGELDPFADAVLDAAHATGAHATGARVVLTQDSGIAELLPSSRCRA